MANDCPPDTASTPEEKGLPGRWKIELVGGHKFDLADLSEAAPGVGAKVLQGGDKWFLHASSFETLSTATKVFDEAKRILGVLMTVVKASGKTTEPVKLGPIFDQQGGPPATIVEAVGVARGRSRAYAVSVAGAGGSTQPDTETTLAKYTRLCASDPEVRRAMDFLNTPGDTFGFLYNAYEIVRDDLGGRKEGAKKAAELAQVPLSELDTFYDNAHYQKLSGDKARHAGSIKRNEEPKTSRKMDLEGEARPLIKRVVRAWVDYKANHAGDPACFTDKT